jgi:hypothetical protein
VSVQSKQDSKERKVRRFADFVALSVSVLDEAEEGTGEGKWRGEDDEDTLVFHGMTMSCSEGTCTLCDEVQCQSYDNASRAFAAFLSRLPKQETSQAADYAHAMEAMEYNLKRTDDKEDEIALDSGSEIHLFSSRAAEKYFSKRRSTTLKIVGVAGSQTASSAGDLVLDVMDSNGVRFGLSLGVAYALDAVPMNLLSVSALLKEGATVHFEKGNSWLQHPDMATRIMLEERRGLFVLPSSKLSGAVTVPDDEGQRVVGSVVLVLPRPRLLQKSMGNPAWLIRSWVQRF